MDDMPYANTKPLNLLPECGKDKIQKPCSGKKREFVGYE
jgi:hypothetical protein